jgi:hypothetical protein
MGMLPNTGEVISDNSLCVDDSYTFVYLLCMHDMHDKKMQMRINAFMGTLP